MPTEAAGDPEREGKSWINYQFQYSLESGEVKLAPLPEPRLHYVVEGAVSLRRSRFLHFDLDLDYRMPAPATVLDIPGPPYLPEYQGHLVHELKQSRQVRTERMEYFDSPVLSALVWISEVERAEEELVE